MPVAGTAPLAGNSIATDRGFIARDMPELDTYLHYRMIDVSSIKELCRRWYPRIYFGQPEKGLAHRALADIKESIRELKYYRRTAFVPEPGPSPAEIAAVVEELGAEAEARLRYRLALGRRDTLVSSSPVRAPGRCVSDGECSSVGRAPGCDPGCRGFESRHSPQGRRVFRPPTRREEIRVVPLRSTTNSGSDIPRCGKPRDRMSRPPTALDRRYGFNPGTAQHFCSPRSLEAHTWQPPRRRHLGARARREHHRANHRPGRALVRGLPRHRRDRHRPADRGPSSASLAETGQHEPATISAPSTTRHATPERCLLRPARPDEGPRRRRSRGSSKISHGLGSQHFASVNVPGP